MPSVAFEQHGAVARLTLCNQDKANVLTASMLEELGDHVARIEKDHSIRVAILTGQGQKCFCGGANIDDWQPLDRDAFAFDWVKFGNNVFNSVETCRVPVIGVANGPAVGGGLELLAACDLRIAEEHAWFALPETSLGVVPGWSGTQRLSRLLPQALHAEMVLAGARLSAEQALHHGLVSHVVAKGDGETQALELAETIADRDGPATQVAKLMLRARESDFQSSAIDSLASGYLANRGQAHA